jgi:hypothetical protein
VTEPTPKRIVPLVVGITDDYNFMNVADPANPTPLSLDLSQRCELVFTLSDTLINAGWTFQRRPITIKDDFGVNFSSYVWVKHSVGGKEAPSSCFKMIYECNRIGEYTYSLFMTDSRGQDIDLDPKITNGTGSVP